jgi:hypothetical protein
MGVGEGVGIGVGATVGAIVGAGVGAGVGDMVATEMECQHGVVVHEAPLRSSRQTQYVPADGSCSKLRHRRPTLEHCQLLHVSTTVPTSITTGAAAGARLKGDDCVCAIGLHPCMSRA